MLLAVEVAELWTLRHGYDAVTCTAAPHPMGVEIRYLINEQPLISRVLPDWVDVASVADAWRKPLEDKGWLPSTYPSVVRH